MNVPDSRPRPPVRLVPPRMTAVMTSSSMPRAALGWALPVRATEDQAGQRGERTAGDVERDPPARDRDAGRCAASALEPMA